MSVFAGVVAVAGVVSAAGVVAAAGVVPAAGVVGGNDSRMDWFMAVESISNPCVANADCISENW